MTTSLPSVRQALDRLGDAIEAQFGSLARREPPPLPRKWLTVQEVAAHYRCADQTVRRLCADDKLPCTKLSNTRHAHWKIDAEQLPTALPE